MNRPLFIGSMGPPKVGKTQFGASVFDSKYIDPTRVFYADNHGSTDAFNLHQWTTTERWGVKHYASDKPEELYKDLFTLRKEVRAGKQRYKMIVLDDWSEYAQSDIDERMDEDDAEKMFMRYWGEHGELMRSTAKLVFPRVTGAHHIALFQAAQMPDPLERKEKGDGKFSTDLRETMLRPFLQGAFASYLPYKLDGLFYQDRVLKGGKHKYTMHFEPTKEEAITNRWLGAWLEAKVPTTMEDPTWDKVYETITKLQDNEEHE